MIAVAPHVAQVIGGAMLLALQSPHHQNQPVRWLLNRWKHSVATDQYVYVDGTDESGRTMPLQFACWTFVSEDWVQRLRESGSTLDYSGDGAESGPYMFFIDIMSPGLPPFELVRQLVKWHIHQNPARQVKGAVYVKHRHGRALVHLIQARAAIRLEHEP